MKRPAFQFYPADWRNNANLRRCTWEARGVWIEVMGLMHDSDLYGVLHWPLKEIAQALGAPLKVVRELATKGVLKGQDVGLTEAFVYVPRSARKDGEPVVLLDSREGPIWYSSRMVKDEYLRTVRGEHTRFGETTKVAPKGGLDAWSSDGSSSSSSSSDTSPSLRSGEGALKARSPRRKKSESSLQAYLDVCKAAGQKPLPPDHPIRAWCADAGITAEMLQVAWCVFRDEHLTGKSKDKTQKDWPAHFANSVRRRWYQLWYTSDQGVCWTSNGLHEKAVLEARHQAKGDTHAAA
jgi:hypothetical protein